VLIKKAIKLDKGSARPHMTKVGKITRAQLEEIAKTKMKDMTAADHGCCRSYHRWFCPLHGRECGGCVNDQAHQKTKTLQAKLTPTSCIPWRCLVMVKELCQCQVR
jgi:hypothetical protein